jgi:uncharacterized protein (TIGR00251 family)
MIQVEVDPRGLILPVKAHAGAKRNGISGEHDGMLKVSVTQAPEKGKANEAIQQVLCKALGLKRSQVQLLSGETATRKRFLIEGQGADLTSLQSRLNELLSTSPNSTSQDAL